jgi:predicted DNA-binding transcriptional regulator AlpA
MKTSEDRNPSRPEYQFINSRELAARWGVPETWIRERVRTRSEDPLPHVRLGKYVRFRWLAPELEAWMCRRIVGMNTNGERRAQTKEGK